MMGAKTYTLTDIIELEQKARRGKKVRYWNELEKAVKQYIDGKRTELAQKEAANGQDA